MLLCNIRFKQLPGRSGCYVVTYIWINFEDALDATLQHNIHFKKLQDAVNATFQHPFQSISQTPWMLRCNIHFNRLRRRSGCYVATKHPFQSTPRRCGCYVVTSIWIDFEDALDATFKTLWVLRSNIHFNQLPRRSGCYCVTSISSNFLDALDATL